MCILHFSSTPTSEFANVEQLGYLKGKKTLHAFILQSYLSEMSVKPLHIWNESPNLQVSSTHLKIRHCTVHPCSSKQTRKIPTSPVSSSRFVPRFSTRLKIWWEWIKMLMFPWPEVEVRMIGLHSSSQPASWYFILCCKADHNQPIRTSTPGPRMSIEEFNSPVW